MASWPRLVFARSPFDGSYLRTPRKALAAASTARNISQPMDLGCGLLHVHPSSDTDPLFSDFAAGGPVWQIFERSRPSKPHRATALVSAILSGRSGRGRRRIFYSPSVSQSPISMAFSCHSPFFHGARLALGIPRSLLRRHNRAHMYPYPSHDRFFPIHHFGVSNFCDTSSYLVSLQFLAQPEMAREVSGDAQIPSLAPYFSKRRPRQKFCRPFSLDRQDLRNLLPPG